ncbi:MAG TPA: ATP--guanido phosphotransferase [Clostridiales bacterium]|nr:ATP--guanido phosphotransferase [Clostridiales bacterium]
MIWYLNEGKDDDVVVFTMVKLSRNIQGYSFPNRMDQSDSEALLQQVKGVYDQDDELKNRFHFRRINDISETDRKILVERQLISPEIINSGLSAGILLDKNETSVVMINEEDHIRIQSIFCGLETEAAWESCVSADRLLARHLPYMYDKELGFLSGYLTTVGTGLQITVVMHLPGMVMTGNVDNITTACEKLNVSLKSVYEFGKKLPGNLYVLTNKITSGETEENLITGIRNVAKQIADQERALRMLLLQQNTLKMEDRVYRALGTFLNARIMSYEESLVLMNDIRLGVYTGMIRNFGIRTMNELLTSIKPAGLQQFKEKPLISVERDIARAEMIRDKMDKYFRKDG